MEKSATLVQTLELFESIREPFQIAVSENDDALRLVVNASSIADLFTTAALAIHADGLTDAAELGMAAELLGQSLHRFIWLPEYRKYQRLNSGEMYLQLQRQWQGDTGWFGGNLKGGAISLPFLRFINLACVLQGSSSLSQLYAKAHLLCTRLILQSSGVQQSEVNHFQWLANIMQENATATDKLVQTALMPAEVPGGELAGANPPITSGAQETPEVYLRQGIDELNALVGVRTVKNEVNRLTNFLNIRQQRLAQGMPASTQSLHFVFAGNPGTGKTTVARILAKILYGFQVLKTPNLIEADRATMVGGYVGQTAIKTTEVIGRATDGVLFIDEAYTLSKNSGEDFGQESIDTLLKKMEDLRDRMIVVVAGYPELMQPFLASNPGLQSRFTRFIEFGDYHVAELCLIFERMCTANAYKLTQEARGYLAIQLNFAFVTRNNSFGNARYVRNVYEQTIGNQSDRLIRSGHEIKRTELETIEACDVPLDASIAIPTQFSLDRSRWRVQCPSCSKCSHVGISMIAQIVKCKCGARFRCPWWNLDPASVPNGLSFHLFDREEDLLGYDVQTQ